MCGWRILMSFQPLPVLPLALPAAAQLAAPGSARALDTVYII